jgi:signal transduction histidine kinase/CheY-like chemotaxis protein
MLKEEVRATIIPDKQLIEGLLEKAYSSRVNDLVLSIELGQEALARSRELNQKDLIAKSLNHLSLFNMIVGSYEQSLSMAKEAIGYFDELKDEMGVANAKYNIAGIYYKTNNFHLGLVYLIDCVKIYKKHNDFHNLARTQKSMGTIYDFLGDINNSFKSYEGSIESARKANDLNLESNAFNPLSGLYLKQNNPEKAMEMIEQSIAMKQKTGDTRGLAFAIYGRGKVYAYLKDYEKAEKDYLNALDIHEHMGEPLGKGMTLYKLGVLFSLQGKDELAKDYFYKALDYCEQYNIFLVRIKSNYGLYQVYKHQDNAVKALDILERYIKIKESVINSQTLMVIKNYELITKMENMEKEAQLQKEKEEIMKKQRYAENLAKVKQDFLSTMSHEIRTPLNAIISIASLLNENHFDKEELELFHSLKFASNNLLMLVNDILDFTKLEQVKVKLVNRPAAFRPFLESLKNTYNGLALEKGLDLSLDVDAGTALYYELDETKLGQILGNLISNAIRYSEKGFVKIEVRKAGSKGANDLVEFKIIDSGVGIPADIREDVFQSFFQTGQHRSRRDGGSGLGLAIVKKLVELHNSTILLDSEVGLGSTFYFTLELKKSTAPQSLPVNISDELNNKSTLIAEDNMVNAIVSRRILAKWGVKSDHAVNGMESVNMAKSKVYDFILMDINMPGMNGFEAAKLIRETNNPNRNTPIYALTADITFENFEEYSKYFNSILLKPIEVSKLFEALVKV